MTHGAQGPEVSINLTKTAREKPIYTEDKINRRGQ